jgi:ferredoxin
MHLYVDTRWCSKCKMCRVASGEKMKFRDDGYPAQGRIADGDLERIEAAVAYCPAGALSLGSV